MHSARQTVSGASGRRLGMGKGARMLYRAAGDGGCRPELAPPTEARLPTLVPDSER